VIQKQSLAEVIKEGLMSEIQPPEVAQVSRCVAFVHSVLCHLEDVSMIAIASQRLFLQTHLQSEITVHKGDLNATNFL
jgi:hypothetical protein